MTRNYGWSFLDIGRRLSRTYNMSRMMLSAFEVETAEGDGYANMLFALELADSFITYRSRYRLDPVLSLVLDLLIVDETNPRSLAFQLSAISTHIDSLPQTGKGRGRTEVQLQALALLSEVRLADVTQLSETDTEGRRHELTAKLSSIVARVPSLSNAITRRYFSVIEKEPQWVRVRSRQSP